MGNLNYVSRLQKFPQGRWSQHINCYHALILALYHPKFLDHAFILKQPPQSCGTSVWVNCTWCEFVVVKVFSVLFPSWPASHLLRSIHMSLHCSLYLWDYIFSWCPQCVACCLTLVSQILRCFASQRGFHFQLLASIVVSRLFDAWFLAPWKRWNWMQYKLKRVANFWYTNGIHYKIGKTGP